VDNAEIWSQYQSYTKDATDFARKLGLGGAATVLRVWMHGQEQQRFEESGTIAGDYEKPRWLDYPAYTLFWTKLAFLLVAFIFISGQLLSRT